MNTFIFLSLSKKQKRKGFFFHPGNKQNKIGMEMLFLRLSVFLIIDSIRCSQVLLHNVKNAECAFQIECITNYVLLTWKIPEENSSRSMFFSN